MEKNRKRRIIIGAVTGAVVMASLLLIFPRSHSDITPATTDENTITETAATDNASENREDTSTEENGEDGQSQPDAEDASGELQPDGGRTEEISTLAEARELIRGLGFEEDCSSGTLRDLYTWRVQTGRNSQEELDVIISSGVADNENLSCSRADSPEFNSIDIDRVEDLEMLYETATNKLEGFCGFTAHALVVDDYAYGQPEAEPQGALAKLFDDHNILYESWHFTAPTC